MASTNLVLTVETMEYYRMLFGAGDGYMRLVTQMTGTRCSLRDTQLNIEGEEENVLLAQKVIQKLLEMLDRREAVDHVTIRYVLSLAREGNLDRMDELLRETVTATYRGKQIKCKTHAQLAYVRAIRDNLLCFGIGPAGTGKTYLAVAMAVNALKNKEIERIVLTRPAVEAGEKLGFLPGDLAQKVDPYLRPLYDALTDMMGQEAFARLMERGAIEIAPLAYMRGRTLSDCFIILDEAQNTTREQMKMFLTRLGFNSRMVVNGDITQIDLPFHKNSGLLEAMEVLRDTPGIGMVALTHKDVVRHELVSAIVSAYESFTGRSKEGAQHAE